MFDVEAGFFQSLNVKTIIKQERFSPESFPLGRKNTNILQINAS
jgi:hypothetical protein